MNPYLIRGINPRTIPGVWALMCYVLIIAVAIALAPPDAFAKDKGLYKVKGNVTDMITGKKIKGATVTLIGTSGTETRTTNKKGKFAFKVPPGQLKMEVSFPDYVSQSKNIYVIDASVAANVELRPNYSVGNPYETAVENGFTGTEEQWLSDMLGVGPEICSYCHNGEVARNGKSHQDEYDELFQQDVVKVSNVLYDGSDGTNDIVTFHMTKNDQPFDCTLLNSANPDGSTNSLNIYYSQYTNTSPSRRWGADLDGDGVGDRISLKGTVTYLSNGDCKSMKAQTTLGNLALTNGIVVVYGENEILGRPANTYISLGRFPFSGYEILGSVDYTSAANVTGCENCHQTPYYKHGYIRGDISEGGGLDFYACKVCHLDNGNGGHVDWQIAVDNPQRWAEIWNGSAVTDAEKTQYAYKTRLMNDVHMSHSMEFPYPQPINTCATCHAGKLTETLSDENFILETCLSCHPVTGGTDTADAKGDFAVDTRDMALKTIWADRGVTQFHLESDGSVTTTPCNVCHTGDTTSPFYGVAPVFSEIHDGYESRIYYKDMADGQYKHYRDAITASIDSVTLDNNVLDIKFSAAGTAGDLSADDVVPTVQVSFYGYDTKDFILSNHTRNKAGLRMEFAVGSADNALFTTVAGTAPNWEVKLDLAAYASDPDDFDIVANIASGVVKKAEVMVRPRLDNADGDSVGLNAVSKTVDVTADGTDMYVANYFQGVDAPDATSKVGNALVKVEKVVDPVTDSKSGCNSCHDQLAITFHSGDRGGNIVVCRSCHVVTSGGSHLEGQSRSIDSYVHAIHRFQAFDVDEIDFTDPVEKARYEEHTEFLFPDFAAINCQRCHTESRAVDNGMRGTFDIPDQALSMPGLLSATDELPGFNFNATPEVVVGPAARACGGCHRAQFIKEDDTGGYAVFNEHTKLFGYRVENDDDDYFLYSIISYIMGLFQ